NFGNPEKPEVAYQLEQAILGLSEAARALETPVVSGNASLYNETPTGAIYPTPSIGMLGVLEDVEHALTIAPAPGDTILLLGALVEQDPSTLAGSEYQVRVHGSIGGLPAIDLVREADVQRLVLAAHDAGHLTAAHDIADGGLAVALAEMCIAAGAGIDATEIEVGARLDAALFGEAPSRFLVATRDPEAVVALAAAGGVP